MKSQSSLWNRLPSLQLQSTISSFQLLLLRHLCFATDSPSQFSPKHRDFATGHCFSPTAWPPCLWLLVGWYITNSLSKFNHLGIDSIAKQWWCLSLLVLYSVVGWAQCIELNCLNLYPFETTSKAVCLTSLYMQNFDFLSTLVSPIYSSWIPLESTGIYLCVDFFIFIYYILSTFQVIPGCSRSFQLILVQFSLK